MMPAIKPHSASTTSEAWDAGLMVRRCPSDEKSLRLLHAWVDPNMDPNTKGAYKFPHHQVSGAGLVGAANVKACAQAIGVLNGGRGGANIPDADRKGVWNHVANHLQDSGSVPAELKAEQVTGLERRAAAMELRAVGDAGARKLGGYAVMWNSETVIGQFFREVFRKGAFTRALADAQDVVCWWQHGAGGPLPLGRTTAGTLRLAEDDQGLSFEVDLPSIQPADDLVVSIQRGDVSEMSFAFSVAPNGQEQWTETEGELPLREVLDADLYDVSPVVFAAYKDTSVGVRSAADVLQAHQAEAGLREDEPAPDSGPVAGHELEIARARLNIERLRSLT